MKRRADSAPQCLWTVGAELGEGPVWVTSERALYFVDIFGHSIHRWAEDGNCRSWKTPAEPGFVFPRVNGGLVCGLRGGLFSFQPRTGAFELLLPVETDRSEHRLNDGYVDDTGRLWFGTMHQDTETPGGALYSLDEGGSIQMHDRDYIVTNGPAISPDGQTLYHNDSARRTIYAFDLGGGVLSNRRVFRTFPTGQYPDGMTIDAEGSLWIAVFNGWCLQQFSPQGEQLDEIRLPCARVTKPAFGGDDLKTLFVTTASSGLEAADRAKQPLAGALFAIRTAVAGRESKPFGRLVSQLR